MSPSVLSQSRSRESRYLRFLQHRQSTSLWLERLAWIAVAAALVCFLTEYMTGASLARWLGLGCLLIALVCIMLEALDAVLERHARSKQQESLNHSQQGDDSASHEESGKQEYIDDSL